MSKEIYPNRRHFLGIMSVTIAAALLGIFSLAKAHFGKTKTGESDQGQSRLHPIRPAAVYIPIEGAFPSLGGATRWLNSQPLTPADLRGKVVLVDFWTYTCINWLRTLPYVRAWSEKYKDQGLVVIG